MAKLDRVLISRDWDNKFNLSYCESIARSTSDHVPICLHSGEEEDQRRKSQLDLKSGGWSMRRLES